MTGPQYNDELFTGYETEEIPSEDNPFCNSTENSSFSESYSHILPAFFFRTAKCRKKPSAYEKKNLRYYYNTTGIILASKLFIEAAACIVFYILMFLCSFSLTPSLSLYYNALSDPSVKYSFRIITAIVSASAVFFVGCRFSDFRPEKLLGKCGKIKTSDIIISFLTGLFVLAISNVITLSEPLMSAEYHFSVLNPGTDIMQITSVALYTCVVVPLTEGLIFRGIALKNFSRASQRFGILMTSFLCALSTCSFPAMVPAFLMSVLLCGMTVKYNTVVPSVILHMTVNLSGMIISVYSSFEWGSDIMLIKVWTIITLVLGGIAAFISVIKHPLPGMKPEQRRRSLPVYLTSVFAVLLVPLYIFAALAKLLYFMYM